MAATWMEKVEKTQNQLIQRGRRHRIIRLLPMIGIFYFCVYILAQYPVVTLLDMIVLLSLIASLAVMMFILPPYLMEEKICH